MTFLLFLLGHCDNGTLARLFVAFVIGQIINDMIQVILVELILIFFIIVVILLLVNRETKVFRSVDVVIFLLSIGFRLDQSTALALLVFLGLFSFLLEHGEIGSVTRLGFLWIPIPARPESSCRRNH